MNRNLIQICIAAILIIILNAGCSKVNTTKANEPCPPDSQVTKLKAGGQSANGPAKKQFFEAVSKGDVNAVKDMLKDNKSLLEIRNLKDATPLLVATKLGQIDVVKVLVENGADVNVTNYKKRNVMHVAATHNQPEIAEYLADHGADLNARSDILSVPLHDAVVNNDLATVKVLVEKGANLNAMSKNGLTPLTAALIRDRKEISDYLMSKGANYDKRAADPKTRSAVKNETFCCENM